MNDQIYTILANKHQQNCSFSRNKPFMIPPCAEGCLSGNFHHKGEVIEQSRQLTLFSGG